MSASGALPYEVRIYGSYFVAEFRGEMEAGAKRDSQSFSALAKYIGVFGTPENEKGESLAMTSPVVTGNREPQKLAMTSPVISGEYMQFVLPFEYTKIESIPRPLNENIHIKAVPRKCVAVTTFSGFHNERLCKEKFDKLYQLVKGKLLDPKAAPKWSVAQYHPPFTLPFLRKNEVWIELPENSDITKLIEAAAPTVE